MSFGNRHLHLWGAHLLGLALALSACDPVVVPLVKNSTQSENAGNGKKKGGGSSGSNGSDEEMPDDPIDVPSLADEVTHPALPNSMASLGDSITAGFVANLDRGEFNPFQVTNISVALAKWGLFDVDAVTALEKRNYSWSTGLKSGLQLVDPVLSHASRIKKRNDSLKTFNAAITGAEAQDVVDKELKNLFDWSRDSLSRGAPEYVTLLIGANDVCAANVASMTPVTDYKGRIDSIVSQLLGAHPDTHVLVNALPPIDELRAVAKDESAADLSAGFYQCQDLWHDTGLCPTLTVVSDPASRVIITQRVADYNQALSDVVAKYRALVGDRVRFAADTKKTKFTKDDLSVDCFHPNPSGQRKLSDASWKASWWKE